MPTTDRDRARGARVERRVCPRELRYLCVQQPKQERGRLGDVVVFDSPNQNVRARAELPEPSDERLIQRREDTDELSVVNQRLASSVPTAKLGPECVFRPS